MKMEIRLRADGRVVTEREFKTLVIAAAATQGKQLALPDLLTPAIINYYGGDPVMEGAQPVAGEFQSIRRDGEEQTAHGWFTKYVLVNWAQEEIDSYKATTKVSKWEAIKVERDRRLTVGGFPVEGHWFYSDLVSRSQFLANARRADLVAAANGDMAAVFLNSEGDPIAVKSMDDGFIPMTANLARAVMDAAELQESKTYKAALIHKAAMEALANPSTYDFAQNAEKTKWPPVFGE
jgi:hypothetical protein